MAGRPVWFAEIDDRVGVAVHAHGLHVQHVAARLTLLPQTLTTATEEPGVTSLERLVDCLPVGEAHHQDLTRAVVLDDHGQQPSHREVQPVGRHPGVRTATPRSARYRLASPTVKSP